MSTNSKLESYLTTLNEHLGAISVSDRSEIIMEIKSHVLDASEKSPDKSIEDVLKDFGSAESIAKKYLEERGIKTSTNTRSPFTTFIKWAFIASAGIMLLLGLTLFMIIKSLTPFVSVNGDKVSIMGGLIHVDDNNFRFGHTVYEIDGKYKSSKLKDVKILASNGKLEFSASPSNEIIWDCKVDQIKGVQPLSKESYVEIDLRKYKELDCEIQIPAQLSSTVTMSNGVIELEEPEGNYDLSLQNGEIKISPLDTYAYNFDLKVNLGSLDKFTSSAAKSTGNKKAINIKARLENGKIKNSSD
ncbi:MAG: DUF1700 domain-containing protein [Bdellovibrionota bacterium]